MKKSGNQKEIDADSQSVTNEKRLKKIFKYIDPNEPSTVCPVRDIFSPVSDKWSVLIIGFLGRYDTIRFNELKKLIYGISSKILSERLKRLERDGYLERKVYVEAPIRVEYKLTALGLSYMNQLLNFGDWIEQHTAEIIKNRKKYDKK